MQQQSKISWWWVGFSSALAGDPELTDLSAHVVLCNLSPHWTPHCKTLQHKKLFTPIWGSRRSKAFVHLDILFMIIRKWSTSLPCSVPIQNRLRSSSTPIKLQDLQRWIQPDWHCTGLNSEESTTATGATSCRAVSISRSGLYLPGSTGMSDEQTQHYSQRWLFEWLSKKLIAQTQVPQPLPTRHPAHAHLPYRVAASSRYGVVLRQSDFPSHAYQQSNDSLQKKMIIANISRTHPFFGGSE